MDTLHFYNKGGYLTPQKTKDGFTRPDLERGTHTHSPTFSLIHSPHLLNSGILKPRAIVEEEARLAREAELARLAELEERDKPYADRKKSRKSVSGMKGDDSSVIAGSVSSTVGVASKLSILIDDNASISSQSMLTQSTINGGSRVNKIVPV